MLACILVPCALLPPAVQQPDWLDRFLAGSRALESGELGGARASFQEALTIVPRHGGTAWQLAAAFAREGTADEAFSWLGKAVDWGGGEEALLDWDPDLAMLRADPRFTAIRDRLRSRDASIGTSVRPMELAWSNRGFAFSASPGADSLVIGRGPNTFLWDRRANEMVAALDRPGERVSWAELSPDGRWVVVSGSAEDRSGDDHFLRVFDTATGDLVRELDDVGWEAQIRFDAEGTRMLAYGARHTDEINVFETNDWRTIFKAPRRDSQKVLSPDGEHLLLAPRQGSDRCDVELWDIENGTRVILQEGLPIFHQSSMGFSGNGKLAFVLEHRTCRLHVYDVEHCEVVRTIESKGAAWMSACFLGAKEELATVDEQHTVQVWNARSGDPLRSFAVQLSRWSALSSSPDGSILLAADFEAGLTAYDSSSGRELWRCDGCVGSFASPRFTPDGSRVLVGRDAHGIEIREARSGVLVDVTPQPGLSAVARGHPTRDEVWLGVRDGSLRRIDASTGATLGCWTLGSSPVVGLSFAVDGSRIATVDDTGVLHSIRTTDGAVEVRIPEAKSAGASPLGPETGWRNSYVELAPNGRFALASGPQGEVRLFSVPGGQKRVEVHASEIFGVWAWSPDSRLLALARENGRVVLIDTSTGAQNATGLHIEANVLALAFEPDGKRIWVGDDRSKVHVLEAGTGNLVRSLDLQDLDAFDTVELGNIVFREDGDLAITTSSGFGVVAAWHPSNGSRVWGYSYDGGNPASLLAAFGRTGERLYVWGQGSWSPRIVDSRTGTMVLDLGKRGISGLIPLADERRVGAMGDGLEMIDAATGDGRWSRVEVRNGQALLRSSSGHVDGSRDALESIHAVLQDHSYPLDALAPALLDPKRVRAAAEGRNLRPARLPPIPGLAWAEPVPRVLRVRPGSAPPRVTLEASCVDGVAAFELLLLGKRIRMEGEEIEPTRRRLTVMLEVPDRGEPIEYRWRAIGANGLLSRALRVAIETDP